MPLVKRTYATLIAVIAMIIVGCGPSSSTDPASSSGNTPNTPQIPGSDSSVVLKAKKVMGVLYIDGSSSYSASGQPTNYSWLQTSAVQGTWIDQTGPMVSLAIPPVGQTTSLTVSLAITAPNGQTETSSIDVQVGPDDQPVARSRLSGPTVVNDVDLGTPGWDIEKQGDYLYVRDESNIHAIDATNPVAPEHIWSISAIDEIRDIAFTDDGNTLIMGDEDGIQFIDITDPENPAVLATLLDIVTDNAAEAIHVSGDSLHTVFGEDYAAYDISDPSNPRPIKRLRFEDSRPWQDIHTVGNRLFLCVISGGLRIYDVNEPGHLVFVGAYSEDRRARDCQYQDQRYYMGGNGSGLAIVDIASPTLPERVGFIDGLGTNEPLEITALEVYGEKAYVAGAVDFQVWDISDESAPSLMGSVAIHAADITVEGQYAYAITHEGRLLTIDIRHPESIRPTMVTNDLPNMTGYEAGFLNFNGEFLQTASGLNPTSITINTTDISLTGIDYFYVEDDRLYLMGDDLLIYDLTNIANPVLLNTIAVWEADLQFVYAAQIIDVDGNRLVMRDMANNIAILDFSNPNDLTVTKPAFFDENYVLLSIEGDTAFVLDDSHSLSTIDYSDPNDLELIDRLEIAIGQTFSLSVRGIRQGDTIVLSADSLRPGYGIALVDVSDHTDLKLVDFLRPGVSNTGSSGIPGLVLTMERWRDYYTYIFDFRDLTEIHYTMLRPIDGSWFASSGNTIIRWQQGEAEIYDVRDLLQ